jgi:hypothetical protein
LQALFYIFLKIFFGGKSGAIWCQKGRKKGAEGGERAISAAAKAGTGAADSVLW